MQVGLNIIYHYIADACMYALNMIVYFFSLNRT